MSGKPVSQLERELSIAESSLAFLRKGLFILLKDVNFDNFLSFSLYNSMRNVNIMKSFLYRPQTLDLFHMLWIVFYINIVTLCMLNISHVYYINYTSREIFPKCEIKKIKLK